MTSIEQAIEAALNHAPELDSFLLTSAIIETVESKHLIPADDTEALIAALGLEVISRAHMHNGEAGTISYDGDDPPLGRAPAHVVRLDGYSMSFLGRSVDCPDCVPAYKLKGKP